ncbi:MAG: FKBP-type peptidyl-prolyl cis-trans isomerase [Chloroflexota bacterium]
MCKTTCLRLGMVGLLVTLSLGACQQADSPGGADIPEKESGQTQQEPESGEQSDATESAHAPPDEDCTEGQDAPDHETQIDQQDAEKPRVVRAGDTVRVHRVGTLASGEVFDSYQGNRYLQFTVGEGEFLPAFEEEIVGMKVGETKTFTIPAEEAYGPHYDALVFTLDRDEFPKDKQLEPGQMVQLADREILLMRALVLNVTASNVTLDANHLLAGEDLTFEVELVKILS